MEFESFLRTLYFASRTFLSFLSYYRRKEIKFKSMKLRKNVLPATLMVFLVSLLSSCQLVVDIFKGGVYVGVILVIVVIAIVIWLLRKIGSK